MVEGNGGMVGHSGVFLLTRLDGRIEAFNGKLLEQTATHYRIQLRDGKITDLLCSSIQKVEWADGGKDG